MQVVQYCIVFLCKGTLNPTQPTVLRAVDCLSGPLTVYQRERAIQLLMPHLEFSDREKEAGCAVVQYFLCSEKA